MSYLSHDNASRIVCGAQVRAADIHITSALEPHTHAHAFRGGRLYTLGTCAIIADDEWGGSVVIMILVVYLYVPLAM